MAKPNLLESAEGKLRKFALGFPGAVEEFPWGHSAFKVKGKSFCFLSGETGVLSLSFKLPSSGRMALTLPFATSTGYGLGKSGWVTAKFQTGDDVPVDRLSEWIEESYRAIAPKKLLAELNNPPEEPPTRKRKG